MRGRIISFGSINIDISVAVERLPRPGETRFGADLRFELGGKGANQAVAALRLGGDATLVGRIGRAGFGAEAKALLAGFGVPLDDVSWTADTSTGVALIQVDAGGENAITVVPGANAAVTAADFDAATSGVLPRVLLLQLEIPLPAMVHAAKRVRAAGGLVVLDPAPAMDMATLRPLAHLADIILPNAQEAAALTGIAPVDAESALAAAQVLREAGVACAIVKRGAAGACLLDDAGARHVPAFPASVVDTVAAGDCFAGALAVALAEDAAVADATRFAAAAAALSVGRKGAAAAMPTRSETEALLRSS